MASETFTFYIQPWYRKSPYFEATKRHGCKSWGLYNHMLLPTMYDDPVTEYNALLHDVTLWDVSVERCVEIRGRDAFELTNLITCRDLTKVDVMQARYVLLTTAWGGIVNDPVLLRLAEDRFWLALADSDALLYVAGVAAGRGFDVHIEEADVAPMQVQGPRSKDVIRDLLGDEVADLRYYWCAEGEVDGIPVVVSRTGWTGEVGYEIYGQDSSRGDELFEAVYAAGEPYGMRVIAPSEARRIEAGIFNYGSDMRTSDTPLHISGLEKYVELDQPNEFIGRDALARLAESGVERKLVGIDIGGEPMTEEGALNDFWPVHERARRTDRPHHRGGMVATSGAQRRLRLGAVLAHDRRDGARGRFIVGHARSGRCATSVRRRRQTDPGLVSGRSVSFDRAAEYYDETRTTDASSLLAILDLLEEEVCSRGPVLELGVGTGQLALPLAERGAQVIGLDLSADMMAVLRSKATRGPGLPLMQADATRVPVRDASLGGAYARWVLHLVPEWMQALGELDRIVVPGGKVAIEPGGFSGPFREIYLRYKQMLGDAVVAVGLSAVDRDEQLDQGFGSLGWVVRREVPVTYDRTVTLREVFEEIPRKRWSWTWRVPDDELVSTTRAVLAWAEDCFGDLDEPLPGEATRWRVYARAS